MVPYFDLQGQAQKQLLQPVGLSKYIFQSKYPELCPEVQSVRGCYCYSMIFTKEIQKGNSKSTIRQASSFCTIFSFKYYEHYFGKTSANSKLQTLVHSLACIQFTCIHLCYQLTQVVDLCKYRSSQIEFYCLSWLVCVGSVKVQVSTVL